MTRVAKRACVLGLAAALLLLASEPFAATTDPQKDKLVRELIAMTGADRVGAQIMDALIQQFRQVYKDVPADYWKDLRSTIQDQELVDRIVPVYAERFSVSELNEVIAFYRSSIGKKLIAELPEITQRSVAIGQDWGRQQTGKLLEKLKADGYTPPPRQ